MTKEQKVNIILKEVNEQYTVPSYMEKFVKDGIRKALNRIEKAESKREEKIQ